MHKKSGISWLHLGQLWAQFMLLPNSLCNWHFINYFHVYGFPPGSVVKNPSAIKEMQIPSLGVRRIPWRRKWLSTPVFLPRKSHGQRSPVGYSPRGHRVGDDWVHMYSPCLYQQIFTYSPLLPNFLKLSFNL